MSEEVAAQIIKFKLLKWCRLLSPEVIYDSMLPETTWIKKCNDNNIDWKEILRKIIELQTSRQFTARKVSDLFDF